MDVVHFFDAPPLRSPSGNAKLFIRITAKTRAQAYSICQRHNTPAHRQTAIINYAAKQQKKHGDDFGTQVYNIAWATMQTFHMGGPAPPAGSGKKKILVSIGVALVGILGTILGAVIVNWINGGGTGGGGGGAGTP